jgi:plastocyanin
MQRPFLSTAAIALFALIGAACASDAANSPARAAADAPPAGYQKVSDLVALPEFIPGLGSKVWFDPIGVLIEPGQTVRWVLEANVHTSTAYHPDNDGHALRIPEAAEPWDCGYLVEPGDHFEATLTVPGVYDYFCAPHEMAGMVGRIIVGKPSGPGTLPFDYFRGDPAARNWRAVPAAAQAAFPAIETVMNERVVRLTA